MPEDLFNPDFATLTVQLLSAYLANNRVASEDLAELIRTTRVALVEDVKAAAEPTITETFTPAVSVRKSLASPAHIISLIDGKPYRTLKRHLASHGLTPDTYRSRYGLPASYPMVAPAYAAHRREIAQKMGLGTRPSGINAPSSSDAPISSSAPNEQSSSASQSEAPAPETTAATRGSSKKPAKSRATDPVDGPAIPASADASTSALPNVAGDKVTSAAELDSEDDATSPPASEKRSKAAKKPDARRKGKAAPRKTAQPAENAQSAAGARVESANSDASAQSKPKRQRIGLFKRSDAPKADAAEEQAGADIPSS